MQKQLIALTLSCLVAAAVNAADAKPNTSSSVWWEAEKPLHTNFPQPRSEAEPGGKILSEGLWIGVDENWKETPFLEYEVTVPQTGTYSFYVRKFWKHGPFRWRFDQQPWQQVGNDPALLDEEYIRMYWGANWVQAGKVNLTPGKHTLRIEVTDNVKPAFFDCFLLTTAPFFPMGANKPGEPLPAAPAGWFNFSQYDTLLDPSPIDLRYLNEKQAGENGFIQVHGENFVQRGKPIRFLGVGASREVSRMPREMIDTLAKFLARKGVNLVRYHSPFFHREGPQAGQVIDEDLDNLYYLIAALKKEGIYTHLSIYFPVWFKPGASGRFAGLTDQTPFAINFFNRDFQEMERDWWRELLTRRNPYTGRALKDDPAVMGVEILNEDSFFFWTFDYKNIPTEQMAILEGMFADWLARKYGSLAKAFIAWNAKHERDDLAACRAGFLPLWDLSREPITPRKRDTARFLAETQKKYFDGQYRFLRDEIGFKGVICGSNWRTASTRMFGALDKWTQVGCDFFDHHGYYGAWSKHEADGTISYASKSLSAWDSGPGEARRELQLPFLCATIAGKPGMVSEYAWIGHNDYRAELPLIVSALASQAGLDAMVLFALSSRPAWLATTKQSWPVLTPSSIAMFPGKALVFRKGLVAATEPQAMVTINVEDMLNLTGNDFTDPASNDANRAGEGRDTSRPGIEMEYFAYGKVAANFTTDKTGTRKPDITKFYDPEAGVLTSANGQIHWPYKRGIFTVRAPQTQGVSGYLARAGRVELPDMVVESPVPFGVVWAIAMDDRPLAQSRKILLQVMTEEKNHDFQTEGEPRRKIVDRGRSPLQVRELAGTVRFLRSDAAKLKVTALDINGCENGRAGTADAITLQPDTIYYLIEK